MKHEPNHKGNVAELAFAAEAAKLLNLATSRRSGNGHIRTTYTANEIDAIGAYCDELRACFLIPIGIAAGKQAMHLRLAPARNGQRAALNWAEKYELGAVAQLAERCRGTAEARGSNPLSSTSQAEAAPTVETVGAHRFRNHFGYYMEQAAQGTEVLVSKRGRPFVRLLGPGADRPLEEVEPDEEIR
jgi:prevent-host-death family protein